MVGTGVGQEEGAEESSGRSCGTMRKILRLAFIQDVAGDVRSMELSAEVMKVNEP